MKVRGFTPPIRLEEGKEVQALYPFQTDALTRAFREPSFLFFNHATGCIYGDAELMINRGGNGSRMKMRDVVHKFNGKHTTSGKKWNPEIPTYIARDVGGVIKLGLITRAWESGIKSTFSITTNSGRTIRATTDHQFLTDMGWKRLDSLTIGDQLYVRGQQKSNNAPKPKKIYRQVCGLRYHPHATHRTTHSPFRVAEHRLIAEANLNGISYKEYINRLRVGHISSFNFIDPKKFAVHHRDDNHLNNNVENLEILTHSEHHSKHGKSEKFRSVLYKTTLETISSICYFGEEPTYDIQVTDEPHNFLANGFVVHNCGKSIVAVAGMQEMIKNRHEFDLAFVFTLRLNKKNFVRTITRTTELSVKNIEGTKAARQKAYEKSDFDVLVLNYEKAHFDFDELSQLVGGKRVLFIFDEVQKILLVNNASKAMKKLVRVPSRSAIWPMSASVVENDPLRYWRCFAWMRPNPLGTQEDFRKQYVEKTIVKDYGFRKEFVDVWNLDALKDIPDRVADYTHVVRKNDPEIAKYFKDTQLIVEKVELSSEDRELYDIIRETVKSDYKQLSHLAKVSYYNTLRLICNTSEALNHTDNQVAQFLRSQGLVFTSDTSAKFETIIEKIKEIRDQGDKVVVFTHWVGLSLLLFAEKLTREGIRYVVHYGTGMSAREAQDAQDQFKGDPEITVFLSSDAGSHGLSFQEARYVIHIEIPHSYDILMQRSDRIDRIDSYHQLLTTYVYVTDDSVEENIWAINGERRRLSSIVQGTNEKLGRMELSENSNDLSDTNLRFLLFGDPQ